MKTRFFFISCFVILFWGISAQWFDIPPALAQAIQTNEAFGGVAPESFAETAGLAGGDITLIIARLIRVVLGLFLINHRIKLEPIQTHEHPYWSQYFYKFVL